MFQKYINYMDYFYVPLREDIFYYYAKQSAYLQASLTFWSAE